MALVCPPSAMKRAAARALSLHPVGAVAVSLLMAILLANGAVLARAQDAPPWIDMSEFTAFGSGCSSEDTLPVFSPDKRSGTIIFHELRSCMPGTNESVCEVEFRLRFPPGWSYSIGTATARGFVQLGDGVRLTHDLSVRHSGTDQTGWPMYLIKGPYENNFEFTRNPRVEVSSACDDDRRLTIQSRLKVVGPEDADCIATVQVAFQIYWKKC